MKKIDKLLITGFLPQFILTSLIALFVLVMQFLWRYIDDIVGKGLEISIIFELLFYQSLGILPLAMPLGVLIASVMVMGGLAERYELAAMKSAGVPLLRIMLPLIFIGFLITGFSFLLSNNIVPVANLKYKSRLYDIRRQKQTLTIDEGEYNYDFNNYVLYVKSKNKTTQELQGIKIYDHTTENMRRGNSNITTAERGNMFLSQQDSFLVLELREGFRYEELTNKGVQHFPHIRMNFKKYQSIFDMSQFNLKKTDEKSFEKLYMMLSSRQLMHGMDSIHTARDKRLKELESNTTGYYHFRRYRANADSLRPKTFAPPPLELYRAKLPDTLPSEFYKMLRPEQLGRSFQVAIQQAQNLSQYGDYLYNDLRGYAESYTVHANEIHRKLSFAFACLVFLFIGAPMGAIVRKGGFGWPILIAILFFTIFFILQMTGEKLAKNLSVSSFVGMWLPCLVLFPFGAWLTYKAMRDSSTLSFDLLKNIIAYLRSFFAKK